MKIESNQARNQSPPNPNIRPLHAPVLLSDGSLVTHSHEPNGSQVASINGKPEMSQAQWQEYCRILRGIYRTPDWKEGQ